MLEKKRPITRQDKKAQIEKLWNVLLCYREDCISGREHDEEWDDLCSIMGWLEDDLIGD